MSKAHWTWEQIVERGRERGMIAHELPAPGVCPAGVTESGVVAPRKPSGILAVILPLPPAALSPNGRCHWAKKSAAAKACRFRAAQEAGDRPDRHAACTVKIQWFAKRALFPDPDNALAMLKSSIDGVADSGFFGNDRNLTYLPIEFAKDAKNPRVEMTFAACAQQKI